MESDTSSVADLAKAINDIGVVVQSLIERLNAVEQRFNNVIGPLEKQVGAMNEAFGKRIGPVEDAIKKIITYLQGQSGAPGNGSSGAQPVSQAGPGVGQPPNGNPDLQGLLMIRDMVAPLIRPQTSPFEQLTMEFQKGMMMSMLDTMNGQAAIARLVTKKINERIGETLAEETAKVIME